MKISLDQLKQKTIAEFNKKWNYNGEFQNKPSLENITSFLTQAIEEAWETGVVEGASTERQFVLNVLDGIDLADAHLGHSPQSRSLRFALHSRPLFEEKHASSAKKNEPA